MCNIIHLFAPLSVIYVLLCTYIGILPIDAWHQLLLVFYRWHTVPVSICADAEIPMTFKIVAVFPNTQFLDALRCLFDDFDALVLEK